MATTLDQRLLSSVVVARRAGVTYRQLDWMVRTGILNPAVAGRGSGTRRGFTDVELLAVWVGGRLCERGAPSGVKGAAVQAVLTRDDPWAEALLVVDLAGVPRFIAPEELADMVADNPNAAARLVGAGWAVSLPPEGLDTTPPTW